MLTLLDKLIDENVTERIDVKHSPQKLIEMEYQSLRRDLENLLNTHSRPLAWDPKWVELKQSLINYGLPDFTNAKMTSALIDQYFSEHIANVIRLFEPRLQRVEITNNMTENYSSFDGRYLSFRIEGTFIQGNNLTDFISYQTYLNAYTRNFTVKNIMGNEYEK